MTGKVELENVGLKVEMLKEEVVLFVKELSFDKLALGLNLNDN